MNACAIQFGPQRALAAQICNLPYRRFSVGKSSEVLARSEFRGVRRVNNPRYDRLEICATGQAVTRHAAPSAFRLPHSAFA